MEFQTAFIASITTQDTVNSNYGILLFQENRVKHMKIVPAFLLLFASIGFFVAALLGGGGVMIAIGLVFLVVSERSFRRAQQK